MHDFSRLLFIGYSFVLLHACIFLGRYLLVRKRGLVREHVCATWAIYKRTTLILLER
jgi:hypothetical protein